jgi:sodium transport system permease protein
MWTVYLKEIRELFLGGKALVFTVLIPILVIPVVFFGFGYLGATMSNRAMNSDLDYAVFGLAPGSAMDLQLARQSNWRRVTLSSIEEVKPAIQDGRIDFALAFPGQFEQRLAAAEQGKLTVYLNGSGKDADVLRKRVGTVIDGINEPLRRDAVQHLGIDQHKFDFLLHPIRIDEHATADLRERVGSIFGGFLPYILLMVCLFAAMYPAIDLGAGEKEHGTLESLLLAPLPRSSLVGAKFLVLFTVGLTSALLMVVTIGFLLTVFGTELDRDIATVMAGVGPTDLILIALMLVPTAAIFASVLLTLSIYAKSYKEASGLMQPLAVVGSMPALVAMLPGVKLDWLSASIPLTNVALAIRELTKGTMDYRMFGVIFVSTTLVAGGLLALCQWWFKREAVLFRD